MTATVTPLDVRPVDATLWVLLTDLTIIGSRGDTWTIPAGTVTDLASVPKAMTPYVPRYGVYTPAAVAHDRLCEIASGLIPSCRLCSHGTGDDADCDLPVYVSRRDADGIFRSLLADLGVSFPRRWCMWAAVRAGAGMSDADLREWSTVLLIAVLVVPFLALPVILTTVLLGMTWLVEWASRLFGRE